MNIDSELLAKFLAGETSDQESHLVEKWADENKKEFTLQRDLWKISAKANLSSYDTQNALETVHKFSKRKTHKIYSLKWISVAASIVLLLGLFFIVQFYSSNSPLILMGSFDPEMHTLPDGTKVWLKEGAQIKYPKKFKGSVREIRLDGEAFFDVHRDEDHPFIINGDVGKVRVLGTSFNLAMDSLIAKVIMESGKVELTSSSGKVVTLTPGFTGEIKNNKIQRYNTIDKNQMAWRTRYFHFEGTPIKKALDDLKMVYLDQIIIDSSFSSDCKIAATFKDQPLSEIITVIGLSCDLEINQEEGTYRFK